MEKFKRIAAKFALAFLGIAIFLGILFITGGDNPPGAPNPIMDWMEWAFGIFAYPFAFIGLAIPMILFGLVARYLYPDDEDDVA